MLSQWETFGRLSTGRPVPTKVTGTIGHPRNSKHKEQLQITHQIIRAPSEIGFFRFIFGALVPALGLAHDGAGGSSADAQQSPMHLKRTPPPMEWPPKRWCAVYLVARRSSPWRRALTSTAASPPLPSWQRPSERIYTGCFFSARVHYLQ